jgi:signal transduction histidine kinase
MENLDKTVAQRLYVQYIFALAVVAFLVIFGQFLIKSTLSKSLDDSHLINIAGRQRMLSQRLTKIVILINNSNISSEQKAFYTKQGQQLVTTWESTHSKLKNNNITLSKKFNVNNTNPIQDLFLNINPHFESLLGIFKKSLFLNQYIITNDLLNTESKYLELMEKIVFQYDKEATDRVNSLKSLEIIIGFLTLGTLLVEAIMIFTPLAEYVKKVISHLTTSEKQLQETNDQLRFSNRMLLQAQQKLETATKEKYDTRRKEDIIKSAALLEGQEEERKRMSREMHDGVGQMLTGIKLTASKLRSFENENPKYKISLNDLHTLINETIEATRTVAFNLMPPILEDYGLVPVISILKEQIERNDSMTINYEVKLINERLPQKLEISIYRIIQEALNNALKHAEAKNFKINIIEKQEIVFIELSDDGLGFDPDGFISNEKSLIHNGVANMKTRCKLLGGSFKLTSTPNQGTNIFVKLPIELPFDL